MSSQSISFKPTTMMRKMSWGVDKKRATSVVIIGIMLSLIAWLYLFQASVVTGAAIDASRLQRKITALQYENDTLRAQIAQAESMARVKQRATELQLAPTAPANIEYLVVPELPSVTSPQPSPMVTLPAPPQSSGWFDAIIDWFAGVSQ